MVPVGVRVTVQTLSGAVPLSTTRASRAAVPGVKPVVAAQAGSPAALGAGGVAVKPAAATARRPSTEA